MNAAAKVEALLREHRFQLVRSNKHRVFQNHESKVYVESATPSDWRVDHNRLKALKRVLDSPVKPLSLAISDYEREQAASVIEGQERTQHAAAGQGKGKQHSSSRGTGYRYVDPLPPTPEELAERERQRQQAIANKQQRREAKLARKAEKEAAAQAVVDKFNQNFGPFLEMAVDPLIALSIERFEAQRLWIIENRGWTEEFFHEFPTGSVARHNDCRARAFAFRQFARSGHADLQVLRFAADYRAIVVRLMQRILNSTSSRAPAVTRLQVLARTARLWRGTHVDERWRFYNF